MTVTSPILSASPSRSPTPACIRSGACPTVAGPTSCGSSGTTASRRLRECSRSGAESGASHTSSRPYLDERGSYAGFDISPKAISWLNEHYAPRLANFRFDLVDVRNVRYRPRRGLDAVGIRFPYGDREFDVVCALAVFMHMQLPEIAHYFEEIARVVAPDGFAVATFRSVRAGEQPPPTRGREWVPVGDGVYSIFPETPGRALAYDDELIRTTIERAGLGIVATSAGSWHGGTPDDSGTPSLGADVFVVKPARAATPRPT